MLGSVTWDMSLTPAVQLLTLPVRRTMPTTAETEILREREREIRGSLLSFDFAVKKVCVIWLTNYSEPKSKKLAKFT